MTPKLLEGSAMSVSIVLLGPSLAFVAASAVVWLVWPASGHWPVWALAPIA
jgi:hypothetical protein